VWVGLGERDEEILEEMKGQPFNPIAAIEPRKSRFGLISLF